MAQRKAISKKMRFEVLKRDKFTCQYCGKKAPEVILQIDHIKPVKSGGKNTMLNLVTSCIDCNQGKGARELSDDSELKKQEKELELLSEKQDQIKMMIKWREQLSNSNELMIKSAENIINKHIEPSETSVNEHGMSEIKSLIYKGCYDEAMQNIELAKSKYPFVDSREKANGFITACGKIVKIDKDPIRAKLNYAKGILRNRIHYFNESKYYSTVAWVDSEEVAQSIIDLAKIVKNWTDLMTSLEELYDA